MKVAIMQPYILPYIGYFQLINAVDLFIIYDDVQFIKRGWVNRNKILLGGKEYLFTVPCIKPSQTKIIQEVGINWSGKELQKLEKTIELAYSKAPYYNDVIKLIQPLFSINKDYLIADLITDLIVDICSYLSISTKIKRSSESNYDNNYLQRGDRLIDIVKREGGSDYINSIGGRELYTKSYFEQRGVNLSFLKPLPFEYSQFDNDFVPWLSIIDVLMFNTIDEIKGMLNNYELV